VGEKEQRQQRSSLPTSSQFSSLSLLVALVQKATRLVVVLVDTHAAEAGVTDVLLDAGLGPATERRPVAEGRVRIPVAPPEVEVLHAIPIAHKVAPLIGVGVDATELRAEDALGGVGKVSHELTVLGGAAEPVLRALNIEPHLTVLDVLGMVVKSLDLRPGIATLGAREHVDIDVLHSTGPGVADALGAVVVGVASAAIAANDGKLVAIVADTLPSAHAEQLRHINTSGSRAHRKACGKSKKSNNKTHFLRLHTLS